MDTILPDCVEWSSSVWALASSSIESTGISAIVCHPNTTKNCNRQGLTIGLNILQDIPLFQAVAASMADTYFPSRKQISHHW